MFVAMRYVFLSFICILFSLAAPIQVSAQRVPQSETQLKLTFAPVVKKVSPAVVNIYAQKKVKRAVRHPFFSDPFFNNFFNNRAFGGYLQERMENTLGSGFIISSEGLIMTNAHVIENAEDVAVYLSDGREFKAEVKLIDEPSDLALLRIDPEGEKIPYLEFSKSENLEVGDLVLAIGNPFGVGQTVTSGIVSAVSSKASNITDFNFFIQTDAAINPGNSGGPLVSLDGQVVGVNTAIFSRDGGSLGIGFAVPSEMALAVIAAEASGQITERGVIRAWVGATGQDVTPDIAKSLGIREPKGVLISEVHPEGPAAEAGLKTGDLVLSMNDRPINDAQELLFRFATLSIGERVKLEYLRKGKKRNAIFEAKPPVEIPPKNATVLKGTHPFSGVEVINVSPAVKVEYSLQGQEEGVIISKPNSQRRYGAISFKPGDGIIAINGQKITSVKQLEKLLETPQQTRGWNVVIRRNGRNQNILIRG